MARTEATELRINGTTETVAKDSVLVEQRDTLIEVTTITIDRNEVGDTLRLTQVTDRYRGRDASHLRDKSEKIMVERDTVYVERRDSVMVHGSGSMVNGYQSGKTALHTTLKWMVALVVAVIILVLVIRFSFR